MNQRNRLGNYLSSSVAGETYKAFVPPALPPNPPPQLNERHYDLMERANRALGRLDGVSALLLDTSLFVYFYVRKEALLSSQIEGTQSSFSDLLLFESKETPNVPIEDVQEVSSYVAAMNHGLKRIRNGFPLSLRLIREVHEILLSKGRGTDKAPGEFRRSQNWIGGTRPGNARFVPPPHEKLPALMGDLEKFLHDQPVRMPLLIKAALAHVQFETIHAGSALRVHQYLQSRPITSVPMAAKALGVTEPTVRTSLTHLKKLRIVKKMTGRQRNRLFVYDKYLDILDEGTAPLRG